MVSSSKVNLFLDVTIGLSGEFLQHDMALFHSQLPPRKVQLITDNMIKYTRGL